MKTVLCTVLAFLLLLTASVGFAEQTEAVEPAWQHIVIVGTLAEDAKIESGRAEVTMVVSVNEGTGAVRFTSLTRDMWVEIPGRGEDRLFMAHRIGGPALSLEVVNNILGMEITKYMSINMDNLKDIINYIGGVEVDLTRAEATRINREVSKRSSDHRSLKRADGVQTLDGMQSMAYMGLLNLDNDFGNNARQRKVMNGMFERLKKMNVLERIAFARMWVSAVRTNMEMADMLALGTAVATGGMKDVKELSLPAKGTYHYGKGKASSIVFDAEAVKRDAHAFILGE